MVSRPPVDCCVQQRGRCLDAERQLFYALWGARCVGPPVCQSESWLALFAVDAVNYANFIVVARLAQLHHCYKRSSGEGKIYQARKRSQRLLLVSKI